MAFFISALMMSVAMFARNLKEAEYYLTPFMLLTVFPAILATVPGTELSTVTEFIPIANVALLFKQLMTDSVGLQSIFSVFLSTTIYAVLSLLFAVWIFQREDVILSEERGIPLTLKRSAFVPRETPTPGMVLVLFALVMLLIFYVGTLAQSAWLIPGLLITEWGLILLPILAILWYIRIDLAKTLNLRLPSVKGVVGAVLLGAGWLLLVMQVGFWHNKVLPMPPELIEEMEKMFALGNETDSLALLLFAVAVSPAICEEMLFRGVLLSGFRKKMPAWAVILVVGALFGLFHLSVYRIFLTGLTGIVLTYLVLRTGSIWTGIVAHFVNNCLGVLIATESLPTRLLEVLNETQIEQQGLPKWILAMALIVFVAGIAIIEMSARKRNDAFG